MFYRATGKGPAARRSKAQATIELTIAFLVCIILLYGAVRLFFWLTQSMYERQLNYEATRIDPFGRIDGKSNINQFYTPADLSLVD